MIRMLILKEKLLNAGIIQTVDASLDIGANMSTKHAAQKRSEQEPAKNRVVLMGTHSYAKYSKETDTATNKIADICIPSI